MTKWQLLLYKVKQKLESISTHIEWALTSLTYKFVCSFVEHDD